MRVGTARPGQPYTRGCPPPAARRPSVGVAARTLQLRQEHRRLQGLGPRGQGQGPQCLPAPPAQVRGDRRRCRLPAVVRAESSQRHSGSGLSSTGGRSSVKRAKVTSTDAVKGQGLPAAHPWVQTTGPPGNSLLSGGQGPAASSSVLLRAGHQPPAAALGGEASRPGLPGPTSPA